MLTLRCRSCWFDTFTYCHVIALVVISISVMFPDDHSFLAVEMKDGELLKQYSSLDLGKTWRISTCSSPFTVTESLGITGLVAEPKLGYESSLRTYPTLKQLPSLWQRGSCCVIRSLMILRVCPGHRLQQSLFLVLEAGVT